MVGTPAAHAPRRTGERSRFGRASRAWRAPSLVVAVTAVAAVGACDEPFTTEGGGAGGAHATTTTSATTSTGNGGAAGTETTTTSPTDTTSLSTTGTGGSAGSGGAGPACAHDLCVSGGPLDPACSGCVATLCTEVAYDCCSLGWDSDCLGAANDQCGTGCDVPAVVIACNAQYGDLASYSLCAQTIDSCVIAVDNTASCNTRCRAGGGRCVSAWAGEAPCDLAVALDCEELAGGNDLQHCFCTIGCNGSAPCSPGAATCGSTGCVPY